MMNPGCSNFTLNCQPVLLEHAVKRTLQCSRVEGYRAACCAPMPSRWLGLRRAPGIAPSRAAVDIFETVSIG
jgi:hypothetical protein